VGATGATGEPGAPGNEGPTGPPGPFPSTLPEGDTITGAYSVSGGGEESKERLGFATISFPYRLVTAPTAKFIAHGESDPAGCSGSAGDPTAANGYLCVYEGASSGIEAEYTAICNVTGGCGFGDFASTTGAFVRYIGMLGDSWYAYGSWAVTG
jgi:hypothetical protein